MVTVDEYNELLDYVHIKESKRNKPVIYSVQSYCNPRTNTISDITINFININNPTKGANLPNKHRFRYGNCNIDIIKEWIGQLYNTIMEEDNYGSKV